ncbi:MAG: M48 family metalloprotease [Candidatus Korarchaeota archaeon]|nr:M48 family metalloprotease [Candidatus Korarchaeota archaeon]
MGARGSITLLGLRVDMMLTLSLIIAVSGFVFIYLLGPSVGLVGGVVLALLFNFFMWLISPYLIKAMYRLRPVSSGEMPWLYSMARMLAERSGLKRMPQVFIAPTEVPNAFAFGSPIFGYGVAVTEGLLRILDEEEIEAVLGHEIGHIKHGDMHVMMIATALPAIFLQIGRWFIWGSMFGYGGSRDRDNSGSLYLLGVALIVIGWLLYLLALRLSRLREFYADAHSALTVERGAEKLQRALVKIAKNTDPRLGAQLASAKALMITDPTQRELDEDLRSIMEREESFFERIMSLFSTHPRLKERLMKLEELKGISG